VRGGDDESRRRPKHVKNYKLGTQSTPARPTCCGREKRAIRLSISFKPRKRIGFHSMWAMLKKLGAHLVRASSEAKAGLSFDDKGGKTPKSCCLIILLIARTMEA
jgi:fructosamine-3-kinase